MLRLLFVFFLLVIAHPAFSADWKPLSRESRLTVDARVLAQPDRRTEEPKDAFYGTLAGWGIGRIPFKATEELELARAEHGKTLNAARTSPAPPLAVDVLKRLTKALPDASPEEFTYSLTVIESPAFRSGTVGGGFLYLSRPLYNAIANDSEHAEDRLAFVLAHEMGHVVRKHCRRGYQLLKVQAAAAQEGIDEADSSKLKKAVQRVVDRTGDRLRFLYEPTQEYQADLFAAHLCRNAGFDVDAGMDVLRWGVQAEERKADPSTDPAHALVSDISDEAKVNQPTAAERLRQWVFERDGVVRGAEYGLWEFDGETSEWTKPERIQAAAGERVIVLVHGMDSELSVCYSDLAKALSGDADFRGSRILGFQYPGDTSLSRAGEFLYRELARALDPSIKPAFVAHSAGGLMTRYYAEFKQGPFARIIMQGTPNHGSDLARLRPVVELKQFVGDLKEGYSQAVENAILDGQGQIAHDLKPGSLFLNHLNNRRFDRGRYAIMRGRRYSGGRMLLLGQAITLGRTLLERKIKRSDGPKILRDRALQTLEKFELPDEVRRGDLLVSLESAELEGVPEIQTYKLSHGKLTRDEETIAATLKILR